MPKRLTFHAEKIPLGSVRYSLGIFSFTSKPMMSVEIPNGLTPPDCVYFCWIPAICLVMYSIVTGSSTVRRCDWHSIRALSMRIRASAVRPVYEKKSPVSRAPVDLYSQDTYQRKPDTHVRQAWRSCGPSVDLAAVAGTSSPRQVRLHPCP